MGSDNTHWRTGTRADDVIYQVSGALRHASRPAREAEPAAFATERTQFVAPAIGAAQAKEAVHQDAELPECVEPVFDEMGQAGTGGFLSLSEKTLGVLLHRDALLLGAWQSQRIARVLVSATDQETSVGNFDAAIDCQIDDCWRK